MYSVYNTWKYSIPQVVHDKLLPYKYYTVYTIHYTVHSIHYTSQQLVLCASDQ